MSCELLDIWKPFRAHRAKVGLEVLILLDSRRMIDSFLLGSPGIFSKTQILEHGLACRKRHKHSALLWAVQLHW